MTLLDKIVTPAFIAFQAHCWFAYAILLTFGPRAWPYATAAAAVKEFVIDPHFETGETVVTGIPDFAGYAAGIILGLLALRFL